MRAMKGTISIFIALLFFIYTGSAQFDEKNTSETNTGRYNIGVVLDHIFISKKNDSLEISETVVFRNEGEEIYYNKDNHTFFAISTPPDIKNLKTMAMECCLIQDEGVVYMDPMRSIARGANFDTQISYSLIHQDQKYVFNKSAIYNTTSISIFIDKKSGIDMEGPYEIITLSGIEYKVLAFNNLRSGEMISIPVKIIPVNSGYFYAGIGLFFLISIGLIYSFKDKILRRKKESTLEELEMEKKNIFMAIYGFEKHAGPENSEEYQKLMEEYRQKAIRICIKIDNFKKAKKKDINDEGVSE